MSGVPEDDQVDPDALTRRLDEDDDDDGKDDATTPARGSHGVEPVFADGQVIADRYVIERYLSEGGMGEVYEGRDRVLGERVALKVLHPEVAADEQLVERFKREIQLARQVTHVNVCRIFDVGFHEQKTFLTMELLAGETLSHRIRRAGPFTPAEALPIALQMGAALAAAHAAGIVHRDFKSGNVMLVPQPGLRAVVTDFGLAHKHGSDALDEAMVGTPAFMAPEQVTAGEITPRTDLYALGVVLFEMVTGKIPFTGKTAHAIARLRLTQPPPTLAATLPSFSDPSGRWETTVARCLQREPEDRFATVEQALESLRGDRRKRKTWPLAVAAVAAVAVGVVIGVAQPRSPLGPSLAQGVMPITADGVGVLSRPSVAVLGFKNVSGAEADAWISTAIAEMLTTEVAAGGDVRTLAGENVARLKTELGLGEGATLAPDTLSEVRAKTGTRYVLSGSFSRLGKGLRLDLRLQDTSSGETVLSVAENGREEDLPQIVGRAGAKLRASLGARPIEEREESAILNASLPSNAEAARYYAEGLLKQRAFEAAAAKDLFEKAIALDADFPQAHSELGRALNFLGYEKRAREEHDRARELAKRLPEEDRLVIEARHALAHRDRERTVAIYGQLYKRFPDDLEWGLGYANALYASGEEEKALALVEDVKKIPGASEDPRIHLTDMRVAYVKNDFPRLLALAQALAARAEARGELPILAEARMMESSYYYFRGELHEGARAAADSKRLATKLGDPDGRASSLETLGLLYLDLGELTKADEVGREALELAEAQGNERRQWVAWTVVGIAAYLKGDLTGARYGFEGLGAAAKQSRSGAGQALADIGLAHMAFLGGKLEASRAVLEKSVFLFKRFAPVRSSAWAQQTLAELYEDLGDFPAAQRVHEEVVALAPTLGEGVQLQRSRIALARVLLKQGNAGEAETLVRQALVEIKRQRLTIDLCYGHLTLALVLAAEGKREEALAAWRIADGQAQGSELYYLRFRRALARAALFGESGTPDERTAARQEVEAMVADLRRAGFVGYRLELELALARIERAAGEKDEARARLTEVARDAEAGKYAALSREAKALLAAK
jgi:eukaryotic-like serine/threonine-protein kinase